MSLHINDRTPTHHRVEPIFPVYRGRDKNPYFLMSEDQHTRSLSDKAAGDIQESGTRVRPMPAIQVEPRRPISQPLPPYILSEAPGESPEPWDGVGSKLDMWL